MLKYKWPGNVRQLKNITEQMSVLSEKRNIDAQQLLKYIPLDVESTQLATIAKSGGEHSYESERELLYKILYELRGNVSDLRRDMNSLRKQLDEARQLNGAAGFQPAQPINTSSYPAVSSKHPVTADDLDTIYNVQAPIYNAGPSTQAEDVIAEEIREPENLNLDDLGKQMLIKALQRNGGNRRNAAKELGISERTLFRRIKQYGLNEQSSTDNEDN